jgi:protein tyrosine/serine phosphatase
MFALAFVLATSALAASDPAVTRARVRPADWGAPVIDASLENCFRVSDELFRCEQPAKRDLPDLQALGIHTLLNLRRYHTDSPDFAKAGLTLVAEPMDAGKVTVDQLVSALRKFRAAPKPVLVHCWHGSDRTGTFVATYRLVFQNWTRAAAIDELRHGGYGFHETAFPNLVTLLENLDIEAVRKRVME